MLGDQQHRMAAGRAQWVKALAVQALNLWSVPEARSKDGSTEPSSDLTPTRAPWHAHASCTQTYNDNKGKQANKETTSKSFCGITCHVTDNLPCGALHASHEGADRRYFEFWAVTSLSERFIAAVATLKQL